MARFLKAVKFDPAFSELIDLITYYCDHY